MIKLKTMFKLIEAYPALLFLMIPLIIFLYRSVKNFYNKWKSFDLVFDLDLIPLKSKCEECKGEGFTYTGYYDDHCLGLYYPKMSEEEKERILGRPLHDPVKCEICKGPGFIKIERIMI